MEAKELRIGNLVQFTTGSIYKVDMLYNDFSSLLYWMPIPLTEEWLLKFGFEIKQGRFGNEYWGKINLYTASNKKIVFCFDGCLKGIKYVHQLQNLYFALTGQELIIK